MERQAGLPLEFGNARRAEECQLSTKSSSGRTSTTPVAIQLDCYLLELAFDAAEHSHSKVHPLAFSPFWLSYAYLHIFIHTPVHTYIHKHTCTRTNTHTHTCTDSHTHTCTWTQTQEAGQEYLYLVGTWASKLEQTDGLHPIISDTLDWWELKSEQDM